MFTVKWYLMVSGSYLSRKVGSQTACFLLVENWSPDSMRYSFEATLSSRWRRSWSSLPRFRAIRIPGQMIVWNGMLSFPMK